MLNSHERDILRVTAAIEGQTVAQIRRRIATGFMDCMKDQDVDYASGYGPVWDLRLSRVSLTDDEMRLMGGLAQNFEDALDRLCALWVAETLLHADGTGADMAYDEHMQEVTGEPGDWWP